MTEQTMIERVARAICNAEGFNPEYLEPGDALGIDGYKVNGEPSHFYWRHYVGRARAAIEEMREPSEMMVKAGVEYALRVTIGGEYRWGDYIKDKHKIMIDAALAEQ